MKPSLRTVLAAGMVLTMPQLAFADQSGQPPQGTQSSRQQGSKVHQDSSGNLVQAGSRSSQQTVIFSFKADMPKDVKNLQQEALRLASDPHLASVQVTEGQNPKISGKLAFASVDEYQKWTKINGNDFFDPIREEGQLTTTMRIRRPGLEQTYGLGPQGLDAFRATYIDKNNRAAGDSDVDAVSIMCEAGADCKANN